MSAGEEDLAYTLIKIYLALFQILIAKKQTDHKLLPALIAGINRSFPYAKGKSYF